MVGGLIFSTFLTLVLVPVVYTLLARLPGASGHRVRPGTEDAGTLSSSSGTAATQPGTP